MNLLNFLLGRWPPGTAFKGHPVNVLGTITVSCPRCYDFRLIPCEGDRYEIHGRPNAVVAELPQALEACRVTFYQERSPSLALLIAIHITGWFPSRRFKP